MPLPRRPVTAGLTVVALLALGFEAAALTNPWHLTGLYPLAREVTAVALFTLAGVLLAAAALWRIAATIPRPVRVEAELGEVEVVEVAPGGVRASLVESGAGAAEGAEESVDAAEPSAEGASAKQKRARWRPPPWLRSRMVPATLVALLAVAGLCVVLPTVALRDSFRRESTGEVLAVSPDGETSAVKSTLDTPTGTRTRVYLRSRSGLFSTESTVPAAECPYDPFARGVPTESVRFTGSDTLAIPIADQPTTIVHFDPSTLLPDRTIPMCPATP